MKYSLRLPIWWHRHILILLALTTVMSCTQEEVVPVAVDFTFSVVDSDFSIPVRVAIANRTVGADAYHWSFEGADRISSTDRNPGTLVYDTAGTYTIRLNASNVDGSQDEKVLEFTLDDAVVVGFETEVQTNNFSPAVFDIENTTEGANSFAWTFEGGDPATSELEQPGSILFTEPGEHRILLKVGNGRETHEFEQTVIVAEALTADFDWEVDFQDDDLQVPVTLSLNNKSIGALEYSWYFSDGTPLSSMEEHPTVTFTDPGTHTLELITDNGKETRTLTKTIEIFADTNLRTFENVIFGVNSAHNADTIGAYFSATTRNVYTKSQAAEVEGSLFDIVFFGLGADFSLNKFVSPDDVSGTTFEAIPNGTQTRIINSLEQCDCPTSFTESQFDAMTDDAPLLTTTIEETEGGRQHFTDEIVPRIVLFETADGRKGAIKIKTFVADGNNSFIETEIKIQKVAR